MTLDLRRLAERSLADEPGTVDRLLSKENAQAILDLLDERDKDQAELVASGLVMLRAAERVAALEEGLRPAIVAAYCRVRHGYIHGAECDSYNGQHIADEVARALLAVAPEPTEVAPLGPQLESALERVAALEEGLRELLYATPRWKIHAGGSAGRRAVNERRVAAIDKARALLAAAPVSEASDE